MSIRTKSQSLAAGLILAATFPLAAATPASAHETSDRVVTAAAEQSAASWRLMYRFTTNAKCAHTGRQGIVKGNWSSWFCQPVNSMTRFELWVQ